MGAGFNVTIQNNVDSLNMITKDSSTNCMYHLDSIFNSKMTPSKGRIGGYCEAKGSGGCAFETSSYSFNVYIEEFENNKPKEVLVATIHGKPGSGLSDDGFSQITPGTDPNYKVDRTFVEESSPSFTYKVSAV
jgi:hypothetical protein